MALGAFSLDIPGFAGGMESEGRLPSSASESMLVYRATDTPIASQRCCQGDEPPVLYNSWRYSSDGAGGGKTSRIRGSEETGAGSRISVALRKAQLAGNQREKLLGRLVQLELRRDEALTRVTKGEKGARSATFVGRGDSSVTMTENTLLVPQHPRLYSNLESSFLDSSPLALPFSEFLFSNLSVDDCTHFEPF
jgi:hypothetical protein